MFGRMRNIVFIDDNTSTESDLEMRPNGRNEALIMVGIDESYKLPLFDLTKILRSKWKINKLKF